jgi:hypothetical protein
MSNVKLVFVTLDFGLWILDTLSFAFLLLPFAFQFAFQSSRSGLPQVVRPALRRARRKLAEVN